MGQDKIKNLFMDNGNAQVVKSELKGSNRQFWSMATMLEITYKDVPVLSGKLKRNGQPFMRKVAICRLYPKVYEEILRSRNGLIC